jgi:hypothetical protein
MAAPAAPRRPLGYFVPSAAYAVDIATLSMIGAIIGHMNVFVIVSLQISITYRRTSTPCQSFHFAPRIKPQ